MTTPRSPPAPAIDKSALALIRRVLCSHAPPSTPLEELLPALTSSPDVDLQLYALLAVVFRDFVYSWYSKITTDTVFVEEVVAVVAHCSRAIEERLRKGRKVDLEVLLLDEVPAIVESHVKDYRLALSRFDTALAPHLTVGEIFHNYHPHPALSSPDTESLYLKLIAAGILAILLPTEDLESDCERSLVREILSGMILRNVVDKLSEPYIIHELITKVLEMLRAPKSAPGASEPVPGSEKKPPIINPRRKRSYNEKISSVLLQHDSNGSVYEKPPLDTAHPAPNYKLVRIPPAVDKLLTIAFRLLSLARAFVSSFVTSLHTPPPPRRKKPLLRMSIFRLIPTYLHLPTLQPWTLGGLLFFTKPFTSRSTRLGVTLDNLLSSSFRAYLSSPGLLVSILQSARTTLFPNSPTSPKVYPTPKEKARIKRAAEKAIYDAIPTPVRGVYLGTQDPEEGLTAVGQLLLEAVQDKEVNKHLVFSLLDLFVGRLAPELLEEGPAELRRGRVGVLDR